MRHDQGKAAVAFRATLTPVGGYLQWEGMKVAGRPRSQREALVAAGVAGIFANPLKGINVRVISHFLDMCALNSNNNNNNGDRRLPSWAYKNYKENTNNSRSKHEARPTDQEAYISSLLLLFATQLERRLLGPWQLKQNVQFSAKFRFM